MAAGKIEKGGKTVEMRARPQYILASDAGAFILGALILIALSRIPLLLSPLALALLLLALGLALGADALIWFSRGVRLARADEVGLTLERGGRRTVGTLDWKSVREVRISRFLGRRRLVVELRDDRALNRIPILRSLLGRRLVIQSEAFPREEFDRFSSALRRPR